MENEASEGTFTHRPGGHVEAAIKAKAHEIIVDAAEDMPFVVEDQGYEAIRVDVVEPSIGTARSFRLSANNTVLQILGADKNRKSAVVLAVDNDVYLSHNYNEAMNAALGNDTTAFYLPAGIGIPIDNQGQYWAAVTTTATNSRVSVIVSLDGA